MKRYAVVGMSHRALKLCIEPILKTYKHAAQVVAFLDLSPQRMAAVNQSLGTTIPTYLPEQFDQMVSEAKPDVVIVASMDCTHEHYVVKALEHHLNVYCEKPLATTAESCRRILAAQEKSRGRVTVTFNYRYMPTATRVRELIQDGAVGKVVSVDLNWYVDTYHGSSYFMRWNRQRANSGGLSIHKASHHFDLIQWWIGQKPVEVFAYGARNFYGADGPRNPSSKDGRTCPTCPERGQCDYYMRWHRDEWRGGQANTALDEHVSGLQAFNHYNAHESRRCIYDSQIDIEDTYSAVVKYDGGATLSYSLLFSAPYEGYRAGINGLGGRIDIEALDRGGRSIVPPSTAEGITHIPLFGGANRIASVPASGGHGGGDPLLQDELFLGPDTSANVQRMAPLMDGVLAVLTGYAVHRSVALGRPVKIADLLAGRE